MEHKKITRRDFLKGAGALGVGAAALSLFGLDAFGSGGVDAVSSATQTASTSTSSAMRSTLNGVSRSVRLPAAETRDTISPTDRLCPQVDRPRPRGGAFCCPGRHPAG